MKNILISEQSDGYGICTDAQIEAVKTRMEIICESMGLSYRYDEGARDFPEDMHDDTKLVFELAMDCIYPHDIPEKYVAAVNAANIQCPIPAEKESCACGGELITERHYPPDASLFHYNKFESGWVTCCSKCSTHTPACWSAESSRAYFLQRQNFLKACDMRIKNAALRG